MSERRWKAIEYIVGGLLGFGVGAGLMGLGMKALDAVGADPITFAVVLATVGGGFAYGCVRVGMAVVRVVSLHARARRHLRAGRWEELAPVARKMVEHDEWYPGVDHPRTVMRRRGLVSVLARVGRFDEAAVVAEHNAWSLSRMLGEIHPDTAAARDVARGLREASRNPAVAERLLQEMRALRP